MNKLVAIENEPKESNSIAGELFAQQYYLLRQKENRIYTDDQLLQLPFVSKLNPHYAEWRVRKKSCWRLLKLLSQKKTALQIAEVGCGNGWLSAQLASLRDVKVTGIDINRKELEQAQQVFRKKQNLNFVYGDLRDHILEDKIFDVIVFAASVQYFPSFKNIITAALQHVALQGEIHIIDSPFYEKQDITAAIQRTKNYFEELGFPGMADFYFHHRFDELKRFDHEIIYNPSALINRFSKNKNPFYHVVIKNRYNYF